MSTVKDWPASVPSTPLMAGFTEAFSNAGVTELAFDDGFTISVQNARDTSMVVKLSIYMTDTEFRNFHEWFTNDLRRGVHLFHYPESLHNTFVRFGKSLTQPQATRVSPAAHILQWNVRLWLDYDNLGLLGVLPIEAATSLADDLGVIVGDLTTAVERS